MRRWMGRISIRSEKSEHKGYLVCNESWVLFMRTIADSRGWLDDMTRCIEQISTEEFSLEDVYQFEKILAEKHPENHNVRAKIRQQLQQLRDDGVIAFLGNGMYRKR